MSYTSVGKLLNEHPRRQDVVVEFWSRRESLQNYGLQS